VFAQLPPWQCHMEDDAHSKYVWSNVVAGVAAGRDEPAIGCMIWMDYGIAAMLYPELAEPRF